MLPGAAT